MRRTPSIGERASLITSRSGAAAVEFALVVLLFVVLLIGVSSASEAWRVKHVLMGAVREGARLASVKPNLYTNDPQVLAVVDDALTQGGIDPATVTKRLWFDNVPAVAGTPVTIDLAYSFTPFVSNLVPGLDQPIPFRASATMRYEWRTQASMPPGPPTPNPTPRPRPTPTPTPPPPSGGGGNNDPIPPGGLDRPTQSDRAAENTNWYKNPNDTRGQGNMGRPPMCPPFGFDRDSGRVGEDRGRPGNCIPETEYPEAWE